MYIHGLHIDGFGVFRDVSVTGLPPGLAVFSGANESGKSTLTEFVRYVLFGPPASDERMRYPPLRGGRHGGRLDVELKDGRRLTIHRSDGQVRVLEADGAEVPESSRSLWGGIERSVFGRVFAVGLEDLQGTRVAEQPDIRAQLFVTGSRGPDEHRLPEVLQRLEQQTASFASRQGREHEVGRCQDRLVALRQELAELRRQAGEFAIAERRRLDLQSEVERRSRRIERIGHQLARTEQLQTARRHRVRVRQYRKTARRLAHARRFPSSGLRRFESLQQEIRDADALAEVTRDNVEHIERQLAEIAIDHRLLDARPAIEQLVGERDRLVSALAELPAATATCEQRRQEYQRRLNDLGPGWDRQRLGALDTSVDVRQQTQRFARELAQDRAAVTTARHKVESQRSQLDAVRQQEVGVCRQAEQFPAPAECRDQMVQARVETVARMRPLLHERDLLRKRDEVRRAATDDIQVQLTDVTNQLAVEAGILPTWFIVTAAVLGVAMAAATTWAGAHLPAAGFLLIAATLTVSLVRLRRRQEKEGADRRRLLLSSQQRLADKQQDLAKEGEQLEREIESAAARLLEMAVAVELDVPENLADLEQATAHWNGQQQALSHWMASQRQVDQARDQVQSATAALADSEQCHREAEQALERRTEAWQRWLAERGVTTGTGPEITGPEDFGVLLEGVQQARDAARLFEDARQAVSRIEDSIAYIRRQFREVIQRCGWESESVLDEDAVIDELCGRLAREIRSEREHRRLAGDRAEFELELGRLERQLAQKRESRLRLLEAAGVDEEEAFRRAAAEFEQWQHHKLAADEEEITLRTLVGSQTAGPQLDQELDQSIPADLADRESQLRTELRQLQAELAADEKETRVIDTQLRRGAADHRFGELLQEQATLRARLDDTVRNWSVRVICRQLLNTARETCERDRQPAVVQRGGEYLDMMTAGRYRFVRSWGDAAIVMESADLDRQQEGVWSGGTADLAHLAIRLGLRELAGHAEPLPVVLDDVLARSDPARQHDAARALLHFAAEQQVILLSCRPDVARLVEQVHQQDNLCHVPVNYFDIDDGTIRRREITEAVVPAPKGLKI